MKKIWRNTDELMHQTFDPLKYKTCHTRRRSVQKIDIREEVSGG